MVSLKLFFRTITNLDYETFSEFRFQVNVRDSGQPSRSAESPAEVVIKVISLSTMFLYKSFEISPSSCQHIKGFF